MRSFSISLSVSFANKLIRVDCLLLQKSFISENEIEAKMYLIYFT